MFVLLDQLRNADQKTSKETNVKLSDWKEYFEDLNNNVKDHIDTKIENSLNEVKNTPIFNELVFHIWIWGNKIP